MSNMRVLVISDSHGDDRMLNRIVEQTDCDHVIHCGDFCTDTDRLPDRSLTVVRGNCDWELVPEEKIWEGAGRRFFVTHGHRYQVNTSLLSVKYKGKEVEADIVCFGHSHFPLCEQSGNMLFLNPGSITAPRGFPEPTYAVVELKSNDDIRVTYYTPNGKVVSRLGGSYSLA
jgi:uncharacterized protein